MISLRDMGVEEVRSEVPDRRGHTGEELVRFARELRGSWQTDKAQVAGVGRFISGAVKPVQERGPKFRAPYSGYSLKQHTG